MLPRVSSSDTRSKEGELGVRGIGDALRLAAREVIWNDCEQRHSKASVNYTEGASSKGYSTSKSCEDLSPVGRS